MENKRYRLADSGGLSLAAADADKLISARDGSAALLYLFLLRSGGTLPAQAAADTLGLSAQELQRALETLRRLGLLRQGEPLPPADELPEYPVEEICARAKQDQGFAAVLDETARIYGRRLSTQETKTLFGIFDYLGMPPEVIFLLVHHCVSRYREKYGPGRLPAIRSIEKEAFEWVNREILTLEQAEAHIQHLAAQKTDLARTRQLLGLYDRALSPSETRYITGWLEQGFPPESIAIAYDRTVLQKGALSWSYMNGILRRWDEKGLHTPEQIEASDARRTAAARPAQGAAAPAASGEDMQRLRRLYDRLKNG